MLKSKKKEPKNVVILTFLPLFHIGFSSARYTKVRTVRRQMSQFLTFNKAHCFAMRQIADTYQLLTSYYLQQFTTIINSTNI